MLEKNFKKILIAILVVITMFIIIYSDLKNVVSKLGLSPTLWSTIIGSIVPISLTIYLWQKEQKERKEQIEKDIRFQKNLIIRTAYISYFEELLEQINEFTVFLKSYVISQTDFLGKKVKKTTKVKNLLSAIILEKEKKVWQLKYKKYAFKSIGIDIYNYEYKGKNINITSYMPYFSITIELNKIYEKKGLKIVPFGGAYIEEYSADDIIKIANEIIDDKETIKELLEFLEILRKDIEEKINYNNQNI